MCVCVRARAFACVHAFSFPGVCVHVRLGAYACACACVHALCLVGVYHHAFYLFPSND